VQAFSTGNWPQFRSFAKEAKQLDADTLRRNPDIAGLNKSVREAVRNTPTVRVKIFQLDGRILFSTDSAQIGTNTGKGAGFLSARLGQPSSELAHYDKFSTFDGEFLNRDVLASYIPLRSGADAPIEGVMVIYTDVTELQASDKGDEHLVTLSVVSVLAVLYGFLFFIVRHAGSVLRKQYEQQRRIEQSLPACDHPRRADQPAQPFASAGSHQTIAVFGGTAQQSACRGFHQSRQFSEHQRFNGPRDRRSGAANRGATSVTVSARRRHDRPHRQR